MTIEELKQSIEQNTYTGQLIVFVVSGDSFIPSQYTRAISKIINLPIRQIESLDIVVSNKHNLFDSDDAEFLNLFFTDDLNYADKALLNQSNLIIVTKTIKDKATHDLLQECIVEVPKLESWQIKSYAYSNLKGIDQRKLDWLLSLCKDNIFRVDQEVSKMNIFTEQERKYIFDDFVEDGIFDDLSSSSVFNLVNAITSKDKQKLLEIYDDIDNIDVSEFGLISLLYSNFKNIINIQLGHNPTAEKLGMSTKQFNAIRYNCGKYSGQQLVDIFEFLTTLDFKIKTGQLPTEILIDYIIQRILSY